MNVWLCLFLTGLLVPTASVHAARPTTTTTAVQPLAPTVDVALVTNAAFQNVTVSASFNVAGPIINESTVLFTGSNIVGTSANTPNSVVQRDSSGSIAAGTVTASTVASPSLATENLATITLQVNNISAPQLKSVTTKVSNTTSATATKSTTTTTNTATLNGPRVTVNKKVEVSSGGNCGMTVVKNKQAPLKTLQYAGFLLTDPTGTYWRMQAPSGVAELDIDPDTLTAGTGIMAVDGMGGLTLGLVDTGDVIAPPVITNSALQTLTASGLIANSATTGTSAATPDTLVLRDAQASFAAGTIAASNLLPSAFGITSTVGTQSFGALSLASFDNVAIDMVRIERYAFIAGMASGIPTVAAIQYDNRFAPQLIDTVVPELTTAQQIVRASRYLYVAGGNGFTVIDAHNPSSLTPGQTAVLGAGSVETLAVQEPYVYTVGSDGTVRVWSINTGTGAPALLTTTVLSSISSIARAVAQGYYLYIWGNDTSGSSLCVVDIHNPSVSITEVGSVSVTSGATAADVVVNGRYAYTTATDGLNIIDLANPATPTVVGSLADSTYGRLAYAGSLVYVLTSNGMIITVDIFDPTNPQPIQTVAVPAGGSTSLGVLATAGQFLSVAVPGGSYLTYNISPLVNMSNGGGGAVQTGPVQVFDTFETTHDLIVQGDLSVGAGLSTGIGQSVTLSGPVSIADQGTLLPTLRVYANAQNATVALFSAGLQSPLQLHNVQAGTGTQIGVSGVPAGYVVGSISSEQYKEDIMSLSDNEKALSEKLIPRRYEVVMPDGTYIARRGFGAQETAQLAHELVTGDPESPASINFPAIVALLVSEVQAGRRALTRLHEISTVRSS